jgi:hypothetical protein
MSLQEELEDLMPANPWSFFNGFISHLNGVLITSFLVVSAVVCYILYIIHLYDSGKLTGTEKSKPIRRGRTSLAQQRQEEKWLNKFD